MLSKMGYKPGMVLGRESAGVALAEPIKLELKADRTGLGHAADHKRKLDTRWRNELELARKRTKMQVSYAGC